MCGIIGFIGGEQAAPILLGGLKKLEYRGYDSAGIAILEDGKIEIAKSKGRLEILSDKIEGGRSFFWHCWDWAHPVGDAWRAVGCEFSSAPQQLWKICDCTQWDYRKLCGIEGTVAGARLYLRL